MVDSIRRNHFDDSFHCLLFSFLDEFRERMTSFAAIASPPDAAMNQNGGNFSKFKVLDQFQKAFPRSASKLMIFNLIKKLYTIVPTPLYLSFRWKVEPFSNTKFRKLNSFCGSCYIFLVLKPANKTILGLLMFFDQALKPLWSPDVMT